MGLWDIAKEQFLDVIEFEDKSNKLIVTKYRRENGDDELKQGSKVIVRESQCAVFLKGGKLADVLLPGTYTLDTENFPILTKLKAFPYLLVSPVIADLYFVIEGILLPEEVEEFIDEQAGLSMAQNNMENFVQYQTARAMRDVVKDQGAWAGIGAEIVLANTMAQNVQKMTSSMECEKSRIEKLRELKELLDEGILTQEEFCAEKKRVLEK